MVRSAFHFVVFAVLSAAVAGCDGGSLSAAKFEEVKDGMTFKEAETVLGPGTAIKTDDIDKMSLPDGAKVPFGIFSPDGKSKSVSYVRWGNERKFILLGFLDDKVKYKFKNGL